MSEGGGGLVGWFAVGVCNINSGSGSSRRRKVTWHLNISTLKVEYRVSSPNSMIEF